MEKLKVKNNIAGRKITDKRCASLLEDSKSQYIRFRNQARKVVTRAMEKEAEQELNNS